MVYFLATPCYYSKTHLEIQGHKVKYSQRLNNVVGLLKLKVFSKIASPVLKMTRVY